VELDFLYPSEGIHRRWDSGYRITSTAATYDQAALVLSIPRKKPTDETQETLRTSDFPSTHVKVNTAVDCSVSIVFSNHESLYLTCYFCRKNGRRTSILHLFVMEEQFHEPRSFPRFS
jgi:hypothetical protein